MLAKTDGLELTAGYLSADRVLTLPETSCDLGDGEELSNGGHLPSSCELRRQRRD